MLERFRIEGYKALRDVTLDLTPVHVLIGPNDSGKSSILEALAAFSRSADGDLAHAFSGLWTGRELVWRDSSKPEIRLSVRFRDELGEFRYGFGCQFPDSGRRAHTDSESYRGEGMASHGERGLPTGGDCTYVGRQGGKPKDSDVHRIREAIRGVQVCRFSPSLIALPSAHQPGVRFGLHTTGIGLATCLDDLLGYDRARFDALESAFREFFAEIEALRLVRGPAFRTPAQDPSEVPFLKTAEGKGIEFKLRGSDVPLRATQASDGLLLVLAYLTILHRPEPPAFLLIEEPENGIHPQRLEEVVDCIKRMVRGQSRTQVLMTSHSPYLLDAFEPEQVTVCVKGEDGAVRVRRLSDCPQVAEKKDVFTLGEIWTAHGDEALVGEEAASE